jgi:protease-4
VALVYARGVCAMESGIKGRATSEHLRRLRHDPRVAAVVLRVDSPGGDGMASEAIAAEVRRLRAAGKPVIVSQGDLAASGGYWLSMDATEILTTPVTITGSIGVIGFWIYDDGLGEKLGLTSDGVQVGKHADLFATLRLPLLGIGPPIRALDPEELEMVKKRILAMYDGFVARVAAGRGLSEARVRELGEGRVWMGGDAVARGLCDRFGTLLDAVKAAREAAGIPAGREIRLVEYPPRQLFRWPSFAPDLPGLLRAIASLASSMGEPELIADPPLADTPPAAATEGDVLVRDYLQLIAAEPGVPLAVMPPAVLELR